MIILDTYKILKTGSSYLSEIEVGASNDKDKLMFTKEMKTALKYYNDEEKEIIKRHSFLFGVEIKVVEGL